MRLLKWIALGLLVSGSASGQTYTTMQWGMDKTATPYAFGANIGGTWRNLGTVSSGGVWSIPSSNLAFTQSGTGAAAQTVDAWAKKQPVTQYDFGAICNSNGTTGNGADDTVAIQAAVNYAVSSGRKLHFAATGTNTCRTTSAITINGGMTFDGDGAPPYLAYGVRGAGSWIYADHTGYAIDITQTAPNTASGVVLSDFGIVRNQTAFNNSTWTPVANNYDINVETSDARLADLMLWNGTKGVRVSQAGNGYGRVTIDGLRGSTFTTGIYVEKTYDLPRINNVHFWPFVGDGFTGPKNYKLANFEALVLKRADGVDVDNFFAINPKNCIAFYQDSGSYGTTLRGQFGNVYCDFAVNGVYVDSSISATGSISAQFSNFVSYGGGAGSGSNGINIPVNSGAYIRFDIANAEISNQDHSLVSLTGSNALVHIGAIRTEGWNYSGASDAAFSIASGNSASIGKITANTNPNGGAWASGAGGYSQAAKSDASGSVAAGPNGDTSAFGLNWALHAGKNQNAQTFLGVSNATSGASAAATIYTIGGTANSYAAWTLADNSGVPTYGLTLGSGVTLFSLPATSFSGPAKPATYTIATLPTCNASLLGSIAVVSNGAAYGTTYGGALSTTGAVTRQVLCTNTGGATTYAWAYN